MTHAYTSSQACSHNLLTTLDTDHSHEALKNDWVSVETTRSMRHAAACQSTTRETYCRSCVITQAKFDYVLL